MGVNFVNIGKLVIQNIDFKMSSFVTSSSFLMFLSCDLSDLRSNLSDLSCHLDPKH